MTIEPELTLEERIRASLQQYRGMQATPAVQAMMAASVRQELETARYRGEDIPDYELVTSIDGSNIFLTVRPPQPKPVWQPTYRGPPLKPSTPPDLDWEAEGRFTEEELTWVWKILHDGAKGHYYVDNFRAAKVWKRTHRVRFKRLSAQGCCGSKEWIAKKWNPAKGRDDLYLLGFNYGH